MAIQIDYEGLVQDCLREVVARTLYLISTTGLPGNHHLYLTFCTHYPGVDMPEYLLERYPEEITIVLQYEFWDLEVDHDAFSVTLTFDDVQERLTIPFGAVVNFVDPSVKFGLQFAPAAPPIDLGKIEKKGAKVAKATAGKAAAKKGRKGKEEDLAQEGEAEESNVLVLDRFRKK